MKADNNAALIRHAAEIDGKYGLRGKKILDIGCGDGFMAEHIAQKYGADHVYGIDMGRKPLQGEHFTIEEGDARNLQFEDNSFDIVYSISTFEHINGIPQTLKEIRRVLKPYGRCHLSFAPIWTSICGHHCYSYWPAFSDSCKQKQEDRDEEIVKALPPWGHLYMKEEEMAYYLQNKGFQDERISAATEYIYHMDDINRLSASELRDSLMSCRMIVRQYSEGVTFSRRWALDQKGSSELTQEIINRVVNTPYAPQDLGIVSMKADLEKYEAF